MFDAYEDGPAALILISHALNLVRYGFDLDLRFVSTPATADPAASADAGSDSVRHPR